MAPAVLTWDRWMWQPAWWARLMFRSVARSSARERRLFASSKDTRALLISGLLESVASGIAPSASCGWGAWMAKISVATFLKGRAAAAKVMSSLWQATVMFFCPQIFMASSMVAADSTSLPSSVAMAT